jgi:hypothetical protein
MVSAYGFYLIIKKLRQKNFLIYFLFLYLTLISLAPLKLSLILARDSSFVEARNWIHNNIKSGSKIIITDPLFDISLNSEALEDYNKSSNEISRKFNYLINNKNKISCPSYYIYYYNLPYLTREKYIQNNYEYILLTWWDKNQRNDNLENLKASGYFVDNLIKKFPDDWENIYYPQIVADIKFPYFDLMRISHSGPVVEIYEVSVK